MTARESLAPILKSTTLRWLVSAFLAGGVAIAWKDSRISRAEASEMIAPVAAETHANSAAILTIEHHVDVLMGRDAVRYDARRQETRPDKRDDAEALAVLVFDREVLAGTPINIAKATALRARVP